MELIIGFLSTDHTNVITLWPLCWTKLIFIYIIVFYVTFKDFNKEIYEIFLAEFLLNTDLDFKIFIRFFLAIKIQILIIEECFFVIVHAVSSFYVNGSIWTTFTNSNDFTGLFKFFLVLAFSGFLYEFQFKIH